MMIMTCIRRQPWCSGTERKMNSCFRYASSIVFSTNWNTNWHINTVNISIMLISSFLAILASFPTGCIVPPVYSGRYNSCLSSPHTGLQQFMLPISLIYSSTGSSPTVQTGTLQRALAAQSNAANQKVPTCSTLLQVLSPFNVWPIARILRDDWNLGTRACCHDSGCCHLWRRQCLFFPRNSSFALRALQLHPNWNYHFLEW